MTTCDNCNNLTEDPIWISDIGWTICPQCYENEVDTEYHKTSPVSGYLTLKQKDDEK